MLTEPAGGQKKAELLETGQASKLMAPNDSRKELTVVTYNIRWRTGDELKQIAVWLQKKDAAIIALQEVDRNKKRTEHTNNARALAETLGMHYAWAAPPAVKGNKEEETGVTLLSPFPLKDISRIVLPHAGPGGRLRVALGATVKIANVELRVYSVHSETRIPVPQKLDQLRAVLEDLTHFPAVAGAIVMGDFNSWEPATVTGIRDLFTAAGFTTSFADNDSTFKRDIVLFDLNLKLDWLWLRGLTPITSGIDSSLTVSDHFPLWTAASLPTQARR